MEPALRTGPALPPIRVIDLCGRLGLTFDPETTERIKEIALLDGSELCQHLDWEAIRLDTGYPSRPIDRSPLKEGFFRHFKRLAHALQGGN